MINYLRSRSTTLAIIAGFGGICLILWSWRLPPFVSAVEVTDNANITGLVTVLSPQISGDVIHVGVSDFQDVHKGQLLIEIDDSIYAKELAQARAQLVAKEAGLKSSFQEEASAKAGIRSANAEIESATAALEQAELNWSRIEALTKKGVVSQSNEDSAKVMLAKASAALEEAKANGDVKQQSLAQVLVDRDGLNADVENAKANMALAEINLNHTKIYAPFDGRLGQIGARKGQYVSAGTQLMALVPSQVWVIANYKESQITNMKIGQPVEFRVDALGGQKMTGTVERFSPATGSQFSVIKSDNATGNFTKIEQRISVRIAIDGNQKNAERLIPGMSVTTSVDTAAR